MLKPILNNDATPGIYERKLTQNDFLHYKTFKVGSYNEVPFRIQKQNIIDCSTILVNIRGRRFSRRTLKREMNKNKSIDNIAFILLKPHEILSMI